MTSRERCLAALNHQEPDRIPVHDEIWGTTLQRWHREGMPEHISVTDYFGYELYSQGADTSMRLPMETIEETDDYIVWRDADGATIRNWRHRTSTPEYRDFLITDRDIWNAHKHLLLGDDYRVDWASGLARNKEWRRAGKFVVYGSHVSFSRMMGAVGSETILMAMATHPGWVADMLITDAELNVDTCHRMIEGGFEFDAAFLGNDMGYRNGALFSPAHYKELVSPAHRLMCDFFHSQNMPVIFHSCGNVREFVPLFIEDGFDCLNPLEVKAGMDLIELKTNFGDKLAFMGGIDVRKMAADDPSLIEEEIRTKFAVAKKGGGYIYHSDHSIPDNVSFHQYCRVMELVKRYGEF